MGDRGLPFFVCIASCFFFLAERCRQPLATLRERLHLSARATLLLHFVLELAYWTLKCTKLRVATIVKQDAVNRVPHHVQIVGLNKLNIIKMSKEEMKMALVSDAQNLLDSEMHEIKGGYECETGCKVSCSVSCSTSKSR